MITLEVEFILNIIAVIKDIENHRNVDTAAIGETLDKQPEKRSECQFIGYKGGKWL